MCVCVVCRFICSLYVCVFALSFLRALLLELNLIMIIMMMIVVNYSEMRSLIIELVLATDMSNHFQQIKTMKNLLSVPDK